MTFGGHLEVFRQMLYRVLQHWIDLAGIHLVVNQFHVNMMTTEVSSQFMAHVSTSLYLALLLASPYIVYEIYRFISRLSMVMKGTALR